MKNKSLLYGLIIIAAGGYLWWANNNKSEISKSNAEENQPAQPQKVNQQVNTNQFNTQQPVATTQQKPTEANQPVAPVAPTPKVSPNAVAKDTKGDTTIDPEIKRQFISQHKVFSQ